MHVLPCDAMYSFLRSYPYKKYNSVKIYHALMTTAKFELLTLLIDMSLKKRKHKMLLTSR